MRTRKFLGKTVDVVEVAVGFVLVLFVQLVLVKAFIIELRGLGRRRGDGMRRLVDRRLDRGGRKRGKACVGLACRDRTFSYV